MVYMRCCPAFPFFGVVLTALPGCSRAQPADRAPKRAAPILPSAPAPPRAARSAEPPVRPRSGLDPTSVAVLEKAIGSADYATRLIAIEAVADAHAEPLLGWLEHALGDPEHDVRMAAVEALDRIHSSRALAVLATVRDDTTEDLDVRAVAAGGLLRTTH